MTPWFVAADVGGGNIANINAAADPLTWPAHVADDVALLLWCAQNTMTLTDPPGWQLVNRVDAVSLRMSLYWRACDGTEAGNISLAASSTNKMCAALAVYRGASLAQPAAADWAWRTENVSGSTHANPSVALPVADCGVITMIGERGAGTTSWTQPAGYTERADTDGLGVGAGGTICAVADDGLATPRQAGAAVTPGVWTSDNAFATTTCETVTLALRPREHAGWGTPIR